METIDLKIIRSNIIRLIREYFWNSGFVETDTSSLVLSPGMEPHIRPIQVKALNGSSYLPTSPEFGMKKLLSKGYKNIFQICKSYRNEPLSSTHLPEFTMLEWYRADSNYLEIMKDCENLFYYIYKNLDKNYEKITLPKVWKKFSIKECFEKIAKIDWEQTLELKKFASTCVEKGFATESVLNDEALSVPNAWDDLFFRVMMNAVEPELKKLNEPIIVYDYPKSQAALSNLYLDKNGYCWAKRFEVYAGGFELANAFDELTNPEEQRKRFIKDMELRSVLYGRDFPQNPIDEEFLNCLKFLPPTGGIALGVDRLVMYFTGAENIKDIIWEMPHFN